MYNKLVIVGTVVSDGRYEIGKKSNKPVFMTKISSNTTFKTGDGELKTDKCTFDIQFWGENAKNAGTLLNRGSLAFVEGRFIEYKNNKQEKSYIVKGDSFKLLNILDDPK